MKSPLLAVEDLHLTLSVPSGLFKALHGLSFTIEEGEVVGLVGESGSGKSLTASAMMGLLHPSHQITGKILFEGDNLLEKTSQELMRVRGNRLSLILQDPGQALNPVLSIGTQLVEGLCHHKKIPWKQAYAEGIVWLEKVGINNPSERMRQYPHELSGGMKQRVLIAMALICQPSLLIADEPTTALDTTVQLQILLLLSALQKQENTSILLITHDLGIVANFCDRVLVMYAGQIVESAPVKELFSSPKHPYTQALLKSKYSLLGNKNERLHIIEGSPPPLNRQFKGCSFSPRCPAAMDLCINSPPQICLNASHQVRCWREHIPASSQN
jgi:oligopeptide/dipeptide ABC transporter ATP-binding protein